MLTRLKIGVRLTIGFAVMNALILAIGAAGIYGATKFGRTLEAVNNQGGKGGAYVTNILNGVWQLRYGIAQFIADPKARAGVVADTPRQMALVEDNLKLFSSELRTPAEKEAVAEFSENYRKYVEARPRWLELYGEGKIEEAAEWRAKTIFASGGAMVKGLEKLVQTQRAAMEAANVVAEQDVALTRALLVGGVLVSVFVGGLAAWLLGRSITRPLEQAVAASQHVADGDLTVELAATGNDEAAQLLKAMQQMTRSLARVVGQVRLGADTIATAAGQIATGNQELSARTQEQATSLEETAASMDQLTGNVKHNADSARQATKLAHSAAEIATKGGQVVGNVVQTMDSITSSSRKIVDIISVIDGIAFQTNILALNAAVEAARAGEQGRGFAVVASEVRTLAQRSADAAKEIKQLIQDSVSNVEAGSALVGEAGQTMQQIVGSIKRVTDIMDEIAAAGQAQTGGIEQVNRAVAEMDHVTQQNARLVEQAASASASLQQQAAELVEGVSVFKLRSDAAVEQIISGIQARSAIAARSASPPALPA